jgi:integrase
VASRRLKNDLVPSNPFARVPVEGRERSRDRVLSDAELGEIWRATGSLGWPWCDYIRFLLLTLQRAAETAGMRWAELGPDLATWELPGERTKNGKAHLVHLAERARADTAQRIAASLGCTDQGGR